MKKLFSRAIMLCSIILFFSCSNRTKEGVVKMENPITYDFSNYVPKPIRNIPGMSGVLMNGEKVQVNNQYLTKDGEPWMPTYGELQFSRYPCEFWEDAILKMKSAGFYGISTYVFWNHHEEIENKWDWTGRRNLRRFLQLCKNEYGFS